MKKEDLWNQYVKKNPCFEISGAYFTQAGLKKFFDTTYQAAHDQGVINGKALAALKQAAQPPGVIDSLFKHFK